jgi:hypothetical protein
VTGHARRSGIEAVAPQQIAQVSETTFSVLPSHLDGHQQTEIGTLGEAAGDLGCVGAAQVAQPQPLRRHFTHAMKPGDSGIGQGQIILCRLANAKTTCFGRPRGAGAGPLTTARR